MLVIILEIYLLFILIKKLRYQTHISLKKLYIILFIQICILFLYRFELFAIGREVYYSDAQNYWEQTLMLFNGFNENINTVNKITGGQNLYILFSYLIQITTPFKNVIFNNISNILLVNNAVMLIALLMSKTKIPHKSVNYFIVFILSNPLIVYSLMRNLKDALLLFLTICIVYFTITIFEDRKIVNILWIIILTYLSSKLRPWNFINVIAVLIACMIIKKDHIRKNKLLKNASMLLLLAVALFTVLIKYSSTLNIWAPIVQENAINQNFMELIIAPLKIFLGPGPLRAIMGFKYFLYTTYIGNFATFIGVVLWWIVFSYMIAIIIYNFLTHKKNKYNYLNLSFLFITIMYLVIYSMQYGGSLELRFRALMYIFASATFICTYRLKWNFVIKQYFILICISVFITGIFISL